MNTPLSPVWGEGFVSILCFYCTYSVTAIAKRLFPQLNVVVSQDVSMVFIIGIQPTRHIHAVGIRYDRHHVIPSGIFAKRNGSKVMRLTTGLKYHTNKRIVYLVVIGRYLIFPR